MDKQDALKAAIEIAKEAARGGNGNPAYTLEAVFQTIVKLLPQATRE